MTTRRKTRQHRVAFNRMRRSFALYGLDDTRPARPVRWRRVRGWSLAWHAANELWLETRSEFWLRVMEMFAHGLHIDAPLARFDSAALSLIMLSRRAR